MESSFGFNRLWHPLAAFGITHPLTAIHADTVINTWIAMAVLFLLMIIGRYFLYQRHSVGSYLAKSVISQFKELIEQSTGTFVYRYYAFIASLFIFIISCNWIALIPHVEEPTKDLNTTLALGIVAFFYIQKEIIQVHGFGSFVKDYLLPIRIFLPLDLLAGLIITPFKLLGEIASVISLSFRLFGNIFGGAIIIEIFHRSIANSFIGNAIGTFLGVNLLLTAFFVIFEGFLQAFVFSILTLTNITMATTIEESEHA